MVRARADAEELAAAEREMGRDLDEGLLDVLAALSLYQFPYYYRMRKYLQGARPLLPLLRELNISQFMRQMMPSCESLFGVCMWHGVHFPCCSQIHMQRTEQGFCYSFNSLTSDNATYCPGDQALRLAPTKRESEGCHLYRTSAAGTLSGLEIFSHIIDFDELPPGMQRDVRAFRVSVFHPSDIPTGHDFFVRARWRDGPHSQVVHAFRLIPSATVGAPALKVLPPHERGCLFPDEHPLALSASYTLENCLIECRQRYVAQNCGCRIYYFDHINTDKRECTVLDLQCLSHASDVLRFAQPRPGAKNSNKWPNMNCSHCLPPCHDMRYTVDFEYSRDSAPPLRGASVYLNVFYKDLGALQYRQDIPFTAMRLLVHFGGVLSFFLGLSILSGVELLYFLTLLLTSAVRRAWAWKRQQQLRRRWWRGQGLGRVAFAKAWEPAPLPGRFRFRRRTDHQNLPFPDHQNLGNHQQQPRLGNSTVSFLRAASDLMF